MAKLHGAELLAFVDANKGRERDEVIEAAGYASKRGGKVSLQRTKFFEQLAAANGHQLGTAPIKPTGLMGKTATYKLRVGPTGLIPVSRAYTDQCKMAPGTYVTVIIEDGAIVLEPVEEAAACAAPVAAEPPAATLAAVA